MAGRFASHPQSVWLRRALFQVHLWTGLGIGLYVLVLSVSGSALVYRRELDKLLCPRTVLVTPRGRRLSEAQLAAVARARYPRLHAARILMHGPRVAGAAVEIWYVFGNRRLERLFDPYSGRDLGDTVACEPAPISRLADLHDNLLGGDEGLAVNGAGAVLLTLMCLTGAVIWWPGVGRWRRSLSLRRHVGWRRFTWDLHSVLGFWVLLLVFMWALTGIYLAYPDPFNALIQYGSAQGVESGAGRLIDQSIDWLVRVHFGRSFGPLVKALWVVLGLVPAALFITGGLMWYNRVLRRAGVHPGRIRTSSIQAAGS